MILVEKESGLNVCECEINFQFLSVISHCITDHLVYCQILTKFSTTNAFKRAN